ncbi:hypothetical protein AVEN_196617-1 [Araneus ventricosus]|uniref:Uncharacterized protein n=1 Tax=Araneus ventricosus TaxID=182803 RepID=A0A4Y2GQ50_ARAVE|nr:hypothetical protein AVEN_196617-1 [Araneus ventricosus]
MAAACNQAIPFHEVVPNGHKIIYNFTVPKLAAKPSWACRENFLTNCEVLPTSWSFEMKLQNVPEKPKVPVSVTLRRNHSLDNPVDAFIQISFSDDGNRPCFDLPRIFTTKTMIPGEVLKDSRTEILQSAEMIKAFNESLFIAVVIRILFCHSTNKNMHDEQDHDDRMYLFREGSLHGPAIAILFTDHRTYVTLSGDLAIQIQRMPQQWWRLGGKSGGGGGRQKLEPPKSSRQYSDGHNNVGI